MKRAIGLVFVTVACIVGFLTVRGTMPFIPIFGSSMEPTLHSGGLLMIKPVNPGDVKVGDIIVYNVPPMVRDYYNYPPVVAHRVIKVNTTPSLGFRTQGDNTGEEPFTIRPMDIRGTVGKQIPFLGLPMLFFQSQQGLIFVIIALVLLALFLYGGEIGRGSNWIHRGIFSPVINEEKRTNRVLTRKMEATEKKMDSTEQALGKFSTAISEYAQHLASHTSAVQSLAEASHELKKGAAEQNRVLAALMENMAKAGQKQETITLIKETPPATEKPAPQAEKPDEVKIPPFHRALYKTATEKPAYKLEKLVPVAEKLVIHARKSVTEAEKPDEAEEPASHRAPDKSYPPGCVRQRHPLARW
jgi:signal peptidase I